MVFFRSAAMRRAAHEAIRFMDRSRRVFLCVSLLSSATLDEISPSRKLQTAKNAETHVPTTSCSRLLYFLRLNVYCVTLKCGDSKGREAQRIHINAFDDASLCLCIRNAPRFFEAYFVAKHLGANTQYDTHEMQTRINTHSAL